MNTIPEVKIQGVKWSDLSGQFQSACRPSIQWNNEHSTNKPIHIEPMNSCTLDQSTNVHCTKLNSHTVTCILPLLYFIHAFSCVLSFLSDALSKLTRELCLRMWSNWILLLGLAIRMLSDFFLHIFLEV